jgi:hypothetical protein
MASSVPCNRNKSLKTCFLRAFETHSLANQALNIQDLRQQQGRMTIKLEALKPKIRFPARFELLYDVRQQKKHSKCSSRKKGKGNNKMEKFFSLFF